MVAIVRSLVCRPSVSGKVVVVGSYEADRPQSSNGPCILIPSEYTIAKIIENRSRNYFDNESEIELDGTVLHYMVSLDGLSAIIYICVAEIGYSSYDAQQYLRAVKDAISSDVQLSSLLPYAEDHELQSQISPILHRLMMTSSQRTPQDERIKDMRRQVEEVKSVMASNVASIMERGERLDSIERRTDELQATSATFKLTAHRVQRRMCLLNAKWTIISVLVGLFVAAVIIILILHACGVFDKK